MHTNMRVYPTLPASDIERARKFYEGLGFQIEGEQGPDGGYSFRAGEDNYFYVYPTTARHGENTAAAFFTEDFDSEVEEFRRRGVKFQQFDMPGVTWDNGVATMGGERGFWFTDSEGNTISVGEWSMAERRMRKAA